MDAKYELNSILKCPICGDTIISTIYSYNEPFSEQDKINFQKELDEKHRKLHEQADEYISLKQTVDNFFMLVKD